LLYIYFEESRVYSKLSTMKYINTKISLKDNEKGIAAFFVTLMVMIIFGILILSFSQISNRQGVNALNRVLSAQALYAAQSGINHTYSIIKYDENIGQAVPQQTTGCNNPNYTGATVGGYSGAPSYTCILVNTQLKTLTYSCPAFCPNNSVIAKVESVQTETQSTPLSKLALSWTDASRNASSCPSSQNSTVYYFPPSASWGNCPEVLRIDLVPFNSGSTTLSEINSSVKTFWLYPRNNTVYPDLDYNQIAFGHSYPANCSGSTCSINITSLTDPAYYVRVQYFYFNSASSITFQFNAYDTNNNQLQFSYSQIQIDSTGVSSNGSVLKRLSAFINPFSTVTSIIPPNYALQATSSICKALIVDHSTNKLYEIPEVPSQDYNSLDPYTNLQYTLDTVNPSQDISITNYNPNTYQPTPSTPSTLLPATGTPALNSTSPVLLGHTEITATNSADSCNPI
jgi:hypothetical protein